MTGSVQKLGAALVMGALLTAGASCTRSGSCGAPAPRATQLPAAVGSTAPADPSAAERAVMVVDQIEARGVTDASVLAALRKVPRHQFIPESMRHLAYADRPLPIGRDQTISQPYIVAVMTELAGVGADSVVLEVGTGSGYQAAVLAEIASRVYSVEIIGDLATMARRTLSRLGYRNIEIRHGDGYQGWPEHAPFDAILVTAAPAEVPDALRQQLAPGGRLVIPVGERYQELRVITRTDDGFEERSVLPVRFVPMTKDLR